MKERIETCLGLDGDCDFHYGSRAGRGCNAVDGTCGSVASIGTDAGGAGGGGGRGKLESRAAEVFVTGGGGHSRNVSGGRPTLRAILGGCLGGAVDLNG